MEEILLELLGFLADVLGEILIQAALEFAIERMTALMARVTARSPIFSGAALLLGGAVVGFVWSLNFPQRSVHRFGFAGSSLFFAPLFTGLAMHFLGRQLGRRGRSPSQLASFWGGALFAFSVAVVRWWMVGRSH